MKCLVLMRSLKSHISTTRRYVGYFKKLWGSAAESGKYASESVAVALKL